MSGKEHILVVEDDLRLTRELKENHSVGIIMLTAKTEVVDRVVGLEIGADDYVTQPWDERELLPASTAC